MSTRKRELPWFPEMEPIEVQLERKRQKMTNCQFHDLPDEIILRVMSNLKAKELIQCGQVSWRIRNISHDKSIWQNVDLSGKKVSTDFVEMILSNRCKYLNLTDSILNRGNLSLRKQSNWMDLISLDLSGCASSSDDLEELLASCNSLETLFLFNIGLTQKMVDSVWENGKQLKYLQLHGAKTKRKRLGKLLKSCHSLEEVMLQHTRLSSKMIKSLSLKNHLTLQKVDFSFCKGLHLKTIELLVNNCIEIKELKLGDSLSKRSLTYLVNNLTTKIEILSLRYQDNLDDVHVMELVERCKRLSVLDLEGTSTSNISMIGIMECLKFTLKELSVVNCEYICYSILLELLDMEQLRVLKCNKGDAKILKKELSNFEINEVQEDNFFGSYAYLHSTGMSEGLKVWEASSNVGGIICHLWLR